MTCIDLVYILFYQMPSQNPIPPSNMQRLMFKMPQTDI